MSLATEVVRLWRLAAFSVAVVAVLQPLPAEAQRRDRGSIRAAARSHGRAPALSGPDRAVAREDRQAAGRERRNDRQSSWDAAREDRQEFREDRLDDWRRVETRLGATVVDLPGDRTAIIVDGTRYYYVGGVYYRPGLTGYVVVAAPAGATIVRLPAGYTTVYVGGSSYYYCAGTYYVWDDDEQHYVVVRGPAGATIAVLPAGYTVTYVNGSRVYVHGHVYYRPYYRNGRLVYVVIDV